MGNTVQQYVNCTSLQFFDNEWAILCALSPESFCAAAVQLIDKTN